MRVRSLFVVVILSVFAGATPASADPDAFVDESSRIPFTPDAETLVTDVEFLDPDADGDLDVFATAGGLDGVQDARNIAFANNGAGVFSRSRVLPRTLGDFTDIEFGDVNGDGFTDAVVSVNVGAERLLVWNVTRARFIDATRNLPRNQPADVTIESRLFDADGDGDRDISPRWRIRSCRPGRRTACI
jgi:hypothetical protein